ncbi:uncharacterized protein [Lolium perenne]|uniref:uncharacterized protein n=1 Tax=Lolium perenne TaxID=4522 RepID=UPI003A99F923
MSDEVRVLQSHVDNLSFSIELSFHGGTAWWLTTIYGPTCVSLQPVSLDEPRALRVALQGPWAVVGDFNLIIDAADRNTSIVDRRAIGLFRRCLNDLELRESPLIGRHFTWSNGRTPSMLVKLDRWFASMDWDDLYPYASLTTVSSSVSEHCPILMSTAVESHVNKRFCFEHFWLKLDGFLDEVKSEMARKKAELDASQARTEAAEATAKAAGVEDLQKRLADAETALNEHKY